MASVSIQRTAVCSGGSHHTITLTMGAVVREVAVTMDDFTGSITDEEIIAWMKVSAKIKRVGDGLTLAQLRTALINGVTVTL